MDNINDYFCLAEQQNKRSDSSKYNAAFKILKAHFNDYTPPVTTQGFHKINLSIDSNFTSDTYPRPRVQENIIGTNSCGISAKIGVLNTQGQIILDDLSSKVKYCESRFMSQSISNYKIIHQCGSYCEVPAHYGERLCLTTCICTDTCLNICAAYREWYECYDEELEKCVWCYNCCNAGVCECLPYECYHLDYVDGSQTYTTQIESPTIEISGTTYCDKTWTDNCYSTVTQNLTDNISFDTFDYYVVTDYDFEECPTSYVNNYVYGDTWPTWCYAWFKTGPLCCCGYLQAHYIDGIVCMPEKEPENESEYWEIFKSWRPTCLLTELGYVAKYDDWKSTGCSFEFYWRALLCNCMVNYMNCVLWNVVQPEEVWTSSESCCAFVREYTQCTDFISHIKRELKSEVCVTMYKFNTNNLTWDVSLTYKTI